jgi:transposase
MTLTRWIKREKEGKLEEVKNKIRKPRKIYPDKLIEYINENPDAYLSEIAQEFNCTHVAVLKALRKLGITRKKRQLHTKNNAQLK